MADTPVLEVYLLRGRKLDPEQQAQNTLEAIQQAGHDITSLYMKAKRIKQIDGKPISIVGVRLTGESFIEHIELVYVQEGKELQKRYSRDDFYEI